MDFAHRRTDVLLADLEQRVSILYSEAYKDLEKKVKVYFASFEKRDKAMKQLVDSGEMTQTDYNLWRQNQIGRGRRFEALRDEVAQRMVDANAVAEAYINDLTPSVMSLNRNYVAYTIEKEYGNIGFTLWNDDTVRRLMVEQPRLLPPTKQDIPKALLWNMQEITKQVASGIIQGESVGMIATRLLNHIPNMNRIMAVRNARTAITAAQNGGRQQSFEFGAQMGLSPRKRWVATKDNRTRHSHGMLDGQTVDYNKPFEYGGEQLMFPGDTSLGASPAMIYNCRCTMRNVEKEGIEEEPRQMRVHNPAWDKATPEERKENNIPRNIVVNEMTYKEWLEWKKALNEL